MYHSTARSATATTGRTVLAIVAILSLLLSFFAVITPIQATHGGAHLAEGHRGTSWDDAGQNANCPPEDLERIEEGEVLWHFVLTDPSADSATLTATFDTDGNLSTVEITETVTSEPREGQGALHFYVITGPATLIDATASIAGGNLVLSHICNEVVPPAPSLTVDKTGPAQSKVGDDAAYTITITNTGNVDLTITDVTDSLAGDLTAAVILACGTLDVGEAACVFNYSYTVEAGDPDQLVNTVTVTAEDAAGTSVNDSDSVTVNLFTPGISVTKEADVAEAMVGDVITYTVKIDNTGSADSPALDITSITDTLVGDLTAECPDTIAVADAPCEFEYTYTVQEGDDDPLINTVRVESNPVGFPNEINGEASAEVDLIEEELGSITIVKEAGCEACATLTRGFFFNEAGSHDTETNELIDSLTEGDGPFLVDIVGMEDPYEVFDADSVRAFDHADPQIEQLFMQYMTTLLNVARNGDDCALLTREFDGMSVAAWIEAAETLLRGDTAGDLTVSDVIDALTAINESNDDFEGEEDDEGVTLDCPEGTSGPLAGVFFDLWMESGDEPGLQMDGDDADTFIDNFGPTLEDGTLVIDELEAGTYYLVETDAPEGCTFDDTPIEVEIPVGDNDPETDDMDVTVNVTNDCEETPPPPPPGDEEGELEIIKIFCPFEGTDDIDVLGPVGEEPIGELSVQGEDELPDDTDPRCTIGAPDAESEGATFTIVGETDDGDPVNLTETTTWGAILTLTLEPGDYTVTELGTGLSADIRVEADQDTVVIVWNFEEELPEGEGRIKIIKFACTGPEGVTFTILPGDVDSAQLPAGATDCDLADATFQLREGTDLSESFTVGSDGIRLIPVEAGTYVLVETDPLDGESGNIVVTEGETTTVIVFNLTEEGEGPGGEGLQPGGGGRTPVGEGTLGGNPLPNTSTDPALTGSVPAALLALVMLAGLGAGGYRMAAEARRRR